MKKIKDLKRAEAYIGLVMEFSLAIMYLQILNIKNLDNSIRTIWLIIIMFSFLLGWHSFEIKVHKKISVVVIINSFLLTLLFLFIMIMRI